MPVRQLSNFLTFNIILALDDSYPRSIGNQFVEFLHLMVIHADTTGALSETNGFRVVVSVNPQTLNAKGSLFLTRPSLGNYVQTRDELERRAGDVFGWVVDGSLRLEIDRELPLEAAADAHRALEGRETTGKVLLIP